MDGSLFRNCVVLSSVQAAALVGGPFLGVTIQWVGKEGVHTTVIPFNFQVEIFFAAFRLSISNYVVRYT